MGAVGGTAWQGALWLAPGHALFLGPAGDTRRHRHHATQLVVGLEGRFLAEVDEGAAASHRAWVVASGAPHRIDGHGRLVAIYWAEGAAAGARGLAGALGSSPARSLPDRFARALPPLLDGRARWGGTHDGPLADAAAAIEAALGADAPPPAPDPLAEEAARGLASALPSSLAVPDLARRLGVPQRELSARFRRAHGLTMRRYTLWLRLKAAVAALAEGASLTTAAHAAGFSDGAHLSRTFVEMFGVAPSASVAASRLHRVDSA